MPDVTEVLIPLLNPNEPEAVLAALHVQEGQAVRAGEALCTLETTKSTADVLAEADGFVSGLRLAPGDAARAGELLCRLAPRRKDAFPHPPAAAAAEPAQSAVPAGLRITRPALELARQHGLDLALLPQGPLVTEGQVRAIVDADLVGAGLRPAPTGLALADGPFDPTAILVYGGGGHGKSLVELLRSLGSYRVVGVVDDGLAPGAPVVGVPVLGGAEALPGLYQDGVRLAVNAVGGIGSLTPRLRVFERLAQAGFACPAVVHPRAWVEPSARLSPGVQVMPHAYVGSEAQVGFGCIINTGAVVSHDCRLGEYANISPGALLAGGVQVGAGALVGMGVTVNLGVQVGDGARLGNSAAVKADVPPHGVVRAGSTWPA